MIKNLPEGTSIGEMNASLQWILSHTARFAGIVLVTIQGNNGFILINLGKPLVYYFRQGNNVLKGAAAYEYFQSQPFIQFDLRKYTVLEMTLALGLTSDGERTSGKIGPDKPVTGNKPEIPALPGSPPPGETTHESSGHQISQSAGENGLSLYEMDASQYPEFLKETKPSPGLPQNETLIEEGGAGPAHFPGSPIRSMENQIEPKKTDIGELILGQIINLPGVLAVTIFRRGLNVVSIGEINPENLVDVAEDLIESAKGLSSVMRTGPFIQVSLQIPAGNIIIAPYYDEYACILTSPEINLGQIRKIIRELPSIEAPGGTGEVV